MGDIYNVEQAGAVGPGASATNNTFIQNKNTLPVDTDYQKLSEELAKLKVHLANIAKGADQWTAIGTVESAEAAAKAKDGNKVFKTLATAGKWVFDAATELGVALAAEVIKKSMGL
jgi:hypothetical protein